MQRRFGSTVITWLSVCYFRCCFCVASIDSVLAMVVGNDQFPSPSRMFLTRSGLPVCRYALGGAARSTQPQSLPSLYFQHLDDATFQAAGAPCFFYYNPHRYPSFMNGIKGLCQDEERRSNLFVMSGGTDRTTQDMGKRLADALEKCGGDYLDLFFLEYVCPYELSDDPGSGALMVEQQSELDHAIRQAQKWKQQGLIRHVGASTHSHRVGAALASHDGLDALMLRYSMSHRNAASKISFPACMEHGKPVLAFCTTRWNNLLDGHIDWNEDSPTSGDCLTFAMAKKPSPVEIILHSARDEAELGHSLSGFRSTLREEEIEQWETYGGLDWTKDGFDEYPEESN